MFIEKHNCSLTAKKKKINCTTRLNFDRDLSRFSLRRHTVLLIAFTLNFYTYLPIYIYISDNVRSAGLECIYFLLWKKKQN